ncbi:alpha/beta fold hydrolase [bacterium]|nr:alpha/beta fold hydrolase [bacterium]
MFYNPQIDSIVKTGNNGAGVLVLHGFTGTPDSMRPVVNELHAQGFSVNAPLLDGHGTTPEKCAQTTWHHWYQSTQKAYMELNEQCSKVFVCGLSMGALLSLKLCIDYPQSISGAACLATPLYLKGWVRGLLPIVFGTPIKKVWKFQKKFEVDIKDPMAKKNFWNYDKMPISCVASIMELQNLVHESLEKITTPLLLVHSRHDSTAPYDSMMKVAQKVSSNITETVTLENSYHVITIDYEKDLVAGKVSEFFNRFL